MAISWHLLPYGEKSEPLHIPSGSIVVCIVQQKCATCTVLSCAFQYVTATLKTSGAPKIPYKISDEESGFLMNIHIGKNL